MPLLQLIWTSAVLVVFLMMIFWVAWYLAVPLILFWFFILVARQGRVWWEKYNSEKQANGCTLRPGTSQPNSSEVIDVDYTEIK